MSQPPGDDRARALRADAAGADPSTDGRGLPYESLYRVSSGEQRPSGVRQYEPSLRPPEGADGFGWLFRDERAVPPVPAVTSPALPLPPTVVRPGSSDPITPPTPSDRPRPRRRRLLAVLIVLLVVAVGAGTGAYLVGRGHGTASGRITDDPSAGTAASTPYAGPVDQVVPVGVDVDCQAPAATDDGGRPVDYAAREMYDGATDTGWRCDGTAVGKTATFTFGSDARIGEVGLLNGYPKVDGTSGVHRYDEYRRATGVTWTFADGASFHQALTDGVQTTQTMRIPVQQSGRVTMTIDATTAAGGSSAGPRHDALVLAEVAFGQVG